LAGQVLDTLLRTALPKNPCAIVHFFPPSKKVLTAVERSNFPHIEETAGGLSVTFPSWVKIDRYVRTDENKDLQKATLTLDHTGSGNRFKLQVPLQWVKYTVTFINNDNKFTLGIGDTEWHADMYFPSPSKLQCPVRIGIHQEFSFLGAKRIIEEAHLHNNRFVVEH